VPAVTRADGIASGRSETVTLEHQAFVYPSRDAFVGEAAPLVRAALDDGDTAFVAAKRANVEALREELGDLAGPVLLEDAGEWCTKPYDRLQAVRRLVARVPPGRRVLAFGEPVWDGPEPVRREWARYESVINLALADAPLRFVCLYDGGVLPDRLLDYALETHPVQVEEGACARCGHYVAPARFSPGAPPVPPAAAPEIPVEEAAAFRVRVAAEARAAGLDPRRTDDLVLAASEVATNALRHGRGPITASLWTEGGLLACRVEDRGSGVRDPLAGWTPPARPDQGGWGLVLARKLCDAVDVETGEHGSAVVLHVALAG
jgi:anti-sigma regulatory factor (Ser/Thr protein kinase)